MKLTKSILKQIIKEELGDHGLKHIKIEKLPNGLLQGVWNTTIDNLLAAEDNDWIGQPDDVDQFEGTRVPDGVGPPRWRQPWEYEEEKNNVYWRESYRDEETTGGPTHLGFIKRMKEYDEAIEANIGTVAESRMKLTKSKLKQVIKEQLQNIIKEGLPTVAFQKFGGLGKGLPGIARQARALKPIGSSDMPAHSPVSADSPSFVLYYDTGEERKIQLDDEQWHQFHDMDPGLQDVEKLRSILSPEDAKGLEDTELMESITKSKLMKIVQEELQNTLKEMPSWQVRPTMGEFTLWAPPSGGYRATQLYPRPFANIDDAKDHAVRQGYVDQYGTVEIHDEYDDVVLTWDTYNRRWAGPMSEGQNSESDPGLEASRKQAASTDHKGSTSFLPREEPKQSSRWNRRNK